MTQPIKPTLLILAAGMGSRYGGLKQVDTVGPNGEAIIDYSIYDAMQAGFNKLVFVIRRDIEADFREAVSRKFESQIEVAYAFQELADVPAGFTVPRTRQKPWGTGHAILVARDAINKPFAVINADDFYGRDSYRQLSGFLKQTEANQYALVGFTLRNTLSEHGTVSRGLCQLDEENYLQDVVEMTGIAKTGAGATYSTAAGETKHLSGDEIVSMNMWGFTPTIFAHLQRMFAAFLNEKGLQPKTEFYIPSAVNDLIQLKQAQAKVLFSEDSWFGMTYREDKEQVTASIRALIEQGVYPQSLF